jgi:hypothetical protein
MTERLIKWTENGVEKAKDVEKKDKIQKNFVIDKDVATTIKALAKEFDVKESRMIEEMCYTFVELLERGKQDQNETTTSTTGRKKQSSNTNNTNKAKAKGKTATTNEQIEGQVKAEEAIESVGKTETKTKK